MNISTHALFQSTLREIAPGYQGDILPDDVLELVLTKMHFAVLHLRKIHDNPQVALTTGADVLRICERYQEAVKTW